MLDAATTTALHPDQQDMPHAYRSAATPSGSRPVWCVVASFPKAERTAHAELHRRGFEAYLPLLTRRLPDRHYRTGPLFPGYLFVRMRLDQPWNPIRYAPGVFSLLSVDGKPSPCPDGAVEAVRAAEASRQHVAAENTRWPPGTPVAVANGVLRNCHGIVIAINHDIADIAMIMFGQLRNLSVHVDSLLHREA